MSWPNHIILKSRSRLTGSRSTSRPRSLWRRVEGFTDMAGRIGEDRPIDTTRLGRASDTRSRRGSAGSMGRLMKSRTSHYTPGGAGAGPQGSSGGMEARVKSGRRKGGPDRDRAYWETPQSAIGRIQGRVVDIESDEPEPGLPTTRRQRISQTLWRRRAALTVGLAAIVVLVAVTVLGRLGSNPNLYTIDAVIVIPFASVNVAVGEAT